MKRIPVAGFVTFLAGSLLAGERTIDFSQCPTNQAPPGFRSTVTGEGQPGEWKVVLDSMPPAWQSFTGRDPVITQRTVLAQVSHETLDEHFPLLIYEGETFGDFSLATRFKIVAGEKEQMAGLAFRIRDEKNYYVIRASALGNNLRFYKFIDGKRSPPIGPEVTVTQGVWHDLWIDCKGNKITCKLDGTERILGSDPDHSFPQGKIGFWTKSDSVSYFGDTRIIYVSRESMAPLLVRDLMKQYPRLLGLKIFAFTDQSPTVRIIASHRPSEVGQAGTQVEREVISGDRVYTGNGKQSVTVTLPLHDRNGDTIAAVGVVMRSFPGQTVENMIVRAMPIVKQMEKRVRSKNELIP